MSFIVKSRREQGFTLRACPTDQISFIPKTGLCRSGGFQVTGYRVTGCFTLRVTEWFHATRYRFQVTGLQVTRLQVVSRFAFQVVSRFAFQVACPTDQFNLEPKSGLCRSSGFHASRLPDRPDQFLIQKQDFVSLAGFRLLQAARYRIVSEWLQVIRRPTRFSSNLLGLGGERQVSGYRVTRLQVGTRCALHNGFMLRV